MYFLGGSANRELQIMTEELIWAWSRVSIVDISSSFPLSLSCLETYPANNSPFIPLSVAVTCCQMSHVFLLLFLCRLPMTWAMRSSVLMLARVQLGTGWSTSAGPAPVRSRIWPCVTSMTRYDDLAMIVLESPVHPKLSLTPLLHKTKFHRLLLVVLVGGSFLYWNWE